MVILCSNHIMSAINICRDQILVAKQFYNQEKSQFLKKCLVAGQEKHDDEPGTSVVSERNENGQKSVKSEVSLKGLLNRSWDHWNNEVKTDNIGF